ncbi:uncharacterized protein LOC111328512 [Stylophora pistillata]|uniref:uncharacterized protein LOC111328512 n=1 Tax=Stylophora pistillata TaxID=50429 RepID=UPI000C03F0A6|nr:uncharacterized protein LOC111328512 [Stylophora pistillata]
MAGYFHVWIRLHKPPCKNRLSQTVFGLPRITVVVFSIVTFWGFLGVSESRECESYRDCLGDYLYCCSGYCRRSCNISCSRNEHCGSPGSLEEYCCKGKCISTSLPCEKPPKEKENALSVPLIALVVIFSDILRMAVACLIRSHWNKLRRLCFDERARQMEKREGSSKVRGAGFVSLEGSFEAESDLTCTERISLQSSGTWVGQDFRIAQPKSSKNKLSGRV